MIPFTLTDWADVPETIHPGEVGTASWKTLHFGDLRIRMVEYSPDYLADHWCTKGHILFCLQGEMITELQDGSQFTLTPGTSYEVSDGMSTHRSLSRHGVKLFIIDGGFLKESN